jgi:hypothetical protein
VQLAPVAAWQLRLVSAIAPGIPTRSVTVMVAPCWENTWSWLAVQPFGTHVSTVASSVALWFELLTE